MAHLILPGITTATGAILCLLMMWMAVVSAIEHEPRAAKRALVLAFLLPLPYGAVGLWPFPGREIVAGALMSVTILGACLLVLPYNPKLAPQNDTPTRQIDERTTIFSRNALQPGSLRFADYYRQNPNHQITDDHFRTKPGLLQPDAALYDPYTFAATRASFEAVATLTSLVDAPPAQTLISQNPPEITRFIKAWAKKLGAASVGITALKDYHIYSHIGRGDDYGKPVTLTHHYAIAFTVEMDQAMLACAPHGPTVMESAQQYLNAGAIAVQLAQFIRTLGYPARAHIDANYRVICPLVAADAGLGELGRMGLLITPRLGPRVRLGVVTTDLPLDSDPRRKAPSVSDFCRICKKCAAVCPGQAIPTGPKEPIDGAHRWQINSEKCFTYWCVAGTDCGRCVSVCPYAHPDNLLHNLIRLGIGNSALFRQFALVMDDFFYGKKPAPHPLPGWMAVVNRFKRPGKA